MDPNKFKDRSTYVLNCTTDECKTCDSPELVGIQSAVCKVLKDPNYEKIIAPAVRKQTSDFKKMRMEMNTDGDPVYEDDAVDRAISKESIYYNQCYDIKGANYRRQCKARFWAANGMSEQFSKIKDRNDSIDTTGIDDDKTTNSYKLYAIRRKLQNILDSEYSKKDLKSEEETLAEANKAVLNNLSSDATDATTPVEEEDPTEPEQPRIKTIGHIAVPILNAATIILVRSVILKYKYSPDRGGKVPYESPSMPMFLLWFTLFYLVIVTFVYYIFHKITYLVTHKDLPKSNELLANSISCGIFTTFVVLIFMAIPMLLLMFSWIFSPLNTYKYDATIMAITGLTSFFFMFILNVKSDTKVDDSLTETTETA